MKTQQSILLFTLYFGILTSFDTKAQGWEWGRSATCGSNYGTSMSFTSKTDPFNNVFIAAVNTSENLCLGSYNFHITGVNDNTQTIVAKYDSAGNVLWAKSSSNGISIPIDIATDKTGNLYLFGTYITTSITFDTVVLTNTSYDTVFTGLNRCYYIVKYNPSGTIVWAKSGANIMPQGLNQWGGGGIATDSTENIYITSSFFDTTLQIGPYVLVNSDPWYNDIFVAKYDPSGNVIWAKSFGGMMDDNPVGIATGSGNKIYMIGNSTSDTLVIGGTTLTPANSSEPGRSNMYLAELDTSGNPLWAKSSTGQLYVSAISVDKDENIYIGGNSNASGMFDTSITLGACSFHARNLLYAAFLAKYNTAGNVIWAKALAPTTISMFSTPNTVFNVINDACDNVWLCGKLNYPDGVKLDSATSLFTFYSSDAVFIAAYDKDGLLTGYSSLPSAGLSTASDNAGNIYLTGYYSRSFTAGADSLNLNNGENNNIFIAKYDPNICYGRDLTHLQTMQRQNAEITLYPNPAGDECTVNCVTGFPAGSNAAMYDLAGKMVRTYPLAGNNSVISLAGISPGVYQCRISTVDHIIGTKLVVVR